MYQLNTYIFVCSVGDFLTQLYIYIIIYIYIYIINLARKPTLVSHDQSHEDTPPTNHIIGPNHKIDGLTNDHWLSGNAIYSSIWHCTLVNKYQQHTVTNVVLEVPKFTMYVCQLCIQISVMAWRNARSFHAS